ncbi:hypothetical protein HOP50_01g08700 [Chloropicon primus]|nr:hypothetical protein HOP50_01g08700 [Chloropicon primus]
MERSGQRKVGAGVLKEQLKELKEESAVLMELQNRLDKSIETLKLHKKQVVVNAPQYSHGDARASTSSTPSMRDPVLENQERTLNQFINSLGSVPPSRAYSASSPYSQRKLHFHGDGMYTANSMPASRSVRGGQVMAVDDPDDVLTTRTEYQQKLYTNNVELEHATNRMAKQEVEIYQLKQKCAALERKAALEGDGLPPAQAAAATPFGLSTPGGHKTPKAASVFASPIPSSSAPAKGHGFTPSRAAAGLDEDSRILQRWGFNTEKQSSYSPSKLRSPLQSGFSGFKQERERRARTGFLDTPTTFSERKSPKDLFGGEAKSPSLRDATLSSHLSPARGVVSSPAPRVRERFLESELIKKNRELSAMSDTLENLSSERGGAGLFGSMGQGGKTPREKNLELELSKKEEVISAMSSTLDDLMLKSKAKADAGRSEREEKLQSEVRKKEEDLQALTSTLQQILSLTAGGGKAGGEVGVQDASALASAFSQAMQATSSSPGAYPHSPTDQSPGLDQQQPWKSPGAGQAEPSIQPVPFSLAVQPDDPFAEIRLATQKLQNAQSVLQQSMASSSSRKSTAQQAARTPPPASRGGRGKGKSKPRMYYV